MIVKKLITYSQYCAIEWSWKANCLCSLSLSLILFTEDRILNRMFKWHHFHLSLGIYWVRGDSRMRERERIKSSINWLESLKLLSYGIICLHANDFSSESGDDRVCVLFVREIDGRWSPHAFVSSSSVDGRLRGRRKASLNKVCKWRASCMLDPSVVTLAGGLIGSRKSI